MHVFRVTLCICIKSEVYGRDTHASHKVCSSEYYSSNLAVRQSICVAYFTPLSTNIFKYYINVYIFLFLFRFMSNYFTSWMSGPKGLVNLFYSWLYLTSVEMYTTEKNKKTQVIPPLPALARNISCYARSTLM